MEIGSTLKVLRVASNLTQATLAGELGITANYLSLIENNKKEPSLTFLKKFSERLKIPLGYFLFVALEGEGAPEEREFKERMNTLLTELLRTRGLVKGNEQQG